jgi:DNA polymerase III subunit alpha
MNKKFQYRCGCSFGYKEQDNKKQIFFEPNIDNINLECSKTWDLISEGNTKGIFQLESRLGRSIAKKLKPENIEQLSALISILRPGTLEAIRDGKSVTNHYIDKKNGAESVDYYHPSLKPILNSTYGEMIYQEQAMEIAKIIAGFNLQEADMLRKAIGKKKPEEMAKIKNKFLKGCASLNIVQQNEAEEIFGWIEKSQRYSFNKSHSISYAMNAYLSAYTKAHFPRIFFASYLRFARDKIDPQEEIKALVQNANEMDVIIKPPDIRLLNALFTIHKNDIYFGLTDIKNVGRSVFDKLLKIVDKEKIDMFSIEWLDLLLKILVNINSSATKSLIECGALSFCNKTRNSMLFEFDIVSNLTKKELDFITENEHKVNGDLKDLLGYLYFNAKINKNRKKIVEDLIFSLKNPPYSLEDSAEWVSDVEDRTLGCAITCSKVDMYDISMTNTSCRDFKNTFRKDGLIIGGELDFINVTKTKNGKNKGSDMAFVNISDSTGTLDSVIFFPDQYRQYRQVLFAGNVVILKGNKSKSGDGFIVENAYIAKS